MHKDNKLNLGPEVSKGTYAQGQAPGPINVITGMSVPMPDPVTWENAHVLVGINNASVQGILAIRREMGDTPLLAALYVLTTIIDDPKKASAENIEIRKDLGLPENPLEPFQ